MRIGIYGGTFDPVHNGHIRVADIIAHELSLDRVYFVTASDTPLKATESKVSGAIRFEMVKAALKGEKVFLPSDAELKRGGKSYTADTLEYFGKNFPGAELFFIVGGDRLADFSKWYCPKRIMRLCSIAAVRRKNAAENYAYLAETIERDFGGTVYVSEEYGPDISSSMIRERVYGALPVSDFLPLPAELILYENALYVPDDIKFIFEKLKTVLDEYRLRHTLLTVREAIGLAYRHGVDTKKARLAAILHDCVKFDREAMDNYAAEHGFYFTDEEKTNPYLIHARMGAFAAREDYGVEDPEILNAIASHTIGSFDMTKLDKVIYLADKLEPSRQYIRINDLRELAYSNLDAAAAAVMKRAIDYTKASGRAIHPSALGIIAALENKKPKG